MFAGNVVDFGLEHDEGHEPPGEEEEDEGERCADEHCNGEGDLRRAISEGIPFEGKTTTVFYIAYEKQKNTMLAIRCEKRAFLFTDGKIKLPVAMANVRETVLSAPRVVLNNYDIIESPHPATGYRKIYAKLDEIDADGSVLLRTLDYYAADYVKWFIRKESIHATKSDKRRLSHIIKVALSKPDALEAFLGAAGRTRIGHGVFKRSLCGRT